MTDARLDRIRTGMLADAAALSDTVLLDEIARLLLVSYEAESDLDDLPERAWAWLFILCDERDRRGLTPR